MLPTRTRPLLLPPLVLPLPVVVQRCQSTMMSLFVLLLLLVLRKC